MAKVTMAHGITAGGSVGALGILGIIWSEYQAVRAELTALRQGQDEIVCLVAPAQCRPIRVATPKPEAAPVAVGTAPVPAVGAEPAVVEPAAEVAP